MRAFTKTGFSLSLSLPISALAGRDLIRPQVKAQAWMHRLCLARLELEV